MAPCAAPFGRGATVQAPAASGANPSSPPTPLSAVAGTAPDKPHLDTRHR
jgi:hypothetical protein